MTNDLTELLRLIEGRPQHEVDALLAFLRMTAGRSRDEVDALLGVLKDVCSAPGFDFSSFSTDELLDELSRRLQATAERAGEVQPA